MKHSDPGASLMTRLALVCAAALCIALPNIGLYSAAAQPDDDAKRRVFRSSDHFSSDDYSNKVEEVVRTLARGQEEHFRKLLSPSLLKRTEEGLGAEAIGTIIRERFIPFFEDFHHLDPTVNTTTTKDGDGNSGLAFFRSFVTKDGEERPFVVYVVEEKGELVVGNLVLNRTLRDMNSDKVKK